MQRRVTIVSSSWTTSWAKMATRPLRTTKVSRTRLLARFLEVKLTPDPRRCRCPGWPSAGLRFADGTDETEMLNRLQTAASKPDSGFSCYTKATMPERWHFTGHERIAPIYCVPEVGWAITNRQEFEVKMGGEYKIKG